MKEPNCGNCDHLLRVEQKRVACRIDGEWHERGYRCNDFKDYVQGNTNENRQAEALEIRREREAKAAEQRQREFAGKETQKDRELAKKFQRQNFWLKIIIAILTIILTAIVSKLLSLW